MVKSAHNFLRAKIDEENSLSHYQMRTASANDKGPCRVISTWDTRDTTFGTLGTLCVGHLGHSGKTHGTLCTLPWDTTETYLRYFRVVSTCNKITLECHRSVTRVLQGCQVSVPALLHEFILREIDVTSITQYFRPHPRLKLHILSVTLLLQGCYRAVT